MLKCETSGCKNERAPKQMLCFHHWWGEYSESPRAAAEKLFKTMDIVTKDSSAEVGLLEYALFEAEKRGMGGKLPFAMTPAEIHILAKRGKQAQAAFNELCSQMQVITNRLTSTLRRFHTAMGECGLVEEQTEHGPVYLLKELQNQGLMPKIKMELRKED